MKDSETRAESGQFSRLDVAQTSLEMDRLTCIIQTFSTNSLPLSDQGVTFGVKFSFSVSGDKIQAAVDSANIEN
jgi:hypothetical protein